LLVSARRERGGGGQAKRETASRESTRSRAM
jgi:hypothetical protein